MSTEKYRQAALIAQATLRAVIVQLHRGIGEQTIGEVCRYGDELLLQLVERQHVRSGENGVARPVEICKNEFSRNVAPEEYHTFQSSIVTDGDVVKITLGVHIDGYTVAAGHTVIIRDPSVQPVDRPLSGPAANAVIGSFLATEAVISVLEGVLSEQHPLHALATGQTEYGSTGQVLRLLVEEVAAKFDLCIVPGSKIRRIKRFVAGQVTVRDSLPSVEWPLEPHAEESDAQFGAKSGWTYIVDIQMAPKLEPEGSVKEVDLPQIGGALDGPSIYTRDHTVRYQLRTNSARSLLSAIDRTQSVYPFKLSYLFSALRPSEVRAGLRECVEHQLVVPEPRTKTVFVPAARPKQIVDVISAREIATVLLEPATKSDTGYPTLIRLSGGRQFPPSWTHSVHTLGEGSIAQTALNARAQQHTGVRYAEIKAKKTDLIKTAAESSETPAMEIEM